MKILWITNIALPEANILLGEKVNPFGGWFVSLASYLGNSDNIQLTIAFPQIGCTTFKRLDGGRITYYLFAPVLKINATQQNNFKQILAQVSPDLVHIFGTEYPHALAWMNILEKEKVVISLQGLVSICARHYLAGVPERVGNHFTLRDFLKQDNLRQQQKKFTKRGKLEIEALRETKHVIGRTTWDKACSTQINPKLQYHFCNETLREPFYQSRWQIDQCQRYSIFISQGSYPIKGLHFVLEAMREIIRQYPNARLYIAGNNKTANTTIKDRLKFSSYGKYQKELINKFNLINHVTFTGTLDGRQMCARYLKSHVFVLTSSIENSPNSLGEAMLLGVPCVASCVGGVQDMLKDRDEGFLYPYDEPYMLAYYVCKIFSDDELALELSSNARVHAAKTHDKEENCRRLLEIYQYITELPT